MQLYAGQRVNAVQRTEPLSEYSRLCALLLPLCMPRAVEETLYGSDQVTLATAPLVRLQIQKLYRQAGFSVQARVHRCCCCAFACSRQYSSDLHDAGQGAFWPGWYPNPDAVAE